MGDRLLSQPLDEIAIDICILEWISLFQMAKCIPLLYLSILKSLHAYLGVEKYFSPSLFFPLILLCFFLIF